MRFFIILLLLTGLTPGRVVVAEPETEVLATVDGIAITAQDFHQYVYSSPQLSGYLNVPGGPRRLLGNMIQERLLVREGERLGIQRPEEAPDNPFAYAMKVKQKLIASCVEPDQRTLRRFYDDHPALFSTPLYLRLRRIGLHSNGHDEDQVLARLKRLRSQLENNRIDFNQAVERFSEDEMGKSRGGDIGFVPVEDPENPVFSQMIQAEEGEIIGPVQEQNMFYLYQVTDRREPILGGYDELHTRVHDQYLQQCRQQSLDKLMAELEKRWPVKILVDDLRTAFQSD